MAQKVNDTPTCRRKYLFVPHKSLNYFIEYTDIMRLLSDTYILKYFENTYTVFLLF